MFTLVFFFKNPFVNRVRVSISEKSKHSFFVEKNNAKIDVIPYSRAWTVMDAVGLFGGRGLVPQAIEGQAGLNGGGAAAAEREKCQNKKQKKLKKILKKKQKQKHQTKTPRELPGKTIPGVLQAGASI